MRNIKKTIFDTKEQMFLYLAWIEKQFESEEFDPKINKHWVFMKPKEIIIFAAKDWSPEDSMILEVWKRDWKFYCWYTIHHRWWEAYAWGAPSMGWRDKSFNTMKEVFKHFSQEHIESMSSDYRENLIPQFRDACDFFKIYANGQILTLF